jgi:S1-C subfamily serine protease
MSSPHRSIFRRSLRTCAALAAGAGVGFTPVLAEENAPVPVFDFLQQSVQTIFEKSRNAIVRIEAVDSHGPLSGTGFFVCPSGTILTSYTVGGESQEIFVNFGGERHPAQRLVGDQRSGVAVLKIEAETPFLSPGNSRELSVASPVIAIGYPMDLPLTPAFGTIGGFDLKFQGRYFATKHIRANVPVQRGEGGAPLLNGKGEVVGILISQLDSGSASFVLPIEAAEKVRRDFIRFHKVRPGWIGVHVTNSAEALSGSTALVEGVISGAPAEKAGLRHGDVILQVGAHRITSLEDVLDASFFLSAEDETLLRIAREGSERELNVMPVDHPDLSRPRPPIVPPPALGSTGESSAPILLNR